MAMELVDFWTVTPVAVTSDGKVEETWLTRFWVDRIHVAVTARFELGRQRIGPVIITGTFQADQVVDTDHLAFDDAGDGRADDFGVCPGVRCRHADLGRRNVRVLRDRQGCDGKQTEDGNDQGNDDGENRPVNKKL